MRARVADFRTRGYRGHSLKIDAAKAEGGPALAVARIIESTTDRQPGEYFLVDASDGLTAESALHLPHLLPDDVDIVLKAPCATWRETLSLRRRTEVRIVLDEFAQTGVDVVQLIADNAAGGVSLKLCKNGDITTCHRQRDICIAVGLTMSVPATLGSDITLTAILPLGQTVLAPLLRCVLDTRDMVGVTTADLDTPIVDGGVRAPDAPGLGISPLTSLPGEPVAVWM